VKPEPALLAAATAAGRPCPVLSAPIKHVGVYERNVHEYHPMMNTEAFYDVYLQ